MPRRTPDVGLKPFEYRVGIGGMPTLGGMFRAGDPATTPVHKHHLIVNARITPAGMESRPGFNLLHDSGVEECIDGISAPPGAYATGGGLLWPGRNADSSITSANAYIGSAFRQIGPGFNESYHLVCLQHAIQAGAVENTLVPGVSPSTIGYNADPWGGPFLYRGKVCELKLVDGPDQDITPQWAIVSYVLPSETPTIDASDITQLIDSPPGTVTFPQYYPYPLGSFRVEAYFPDDPATINPQRVVVQPAATTNPVDGTPGVIDNLWFINIDDGTDVTIKRFDGITLSTVYTASVASPDQYFLAEGAYGPVYFAAQADGTFLESAFAKEDGTWATTSAPPVTVSPQQGCYWGGYTYIFGQGENAQTVRGIRKAIGATSWTSYWSDGGGFDVHKMLPGRRRSAVRRKWFYHLKETQEVGSPIRVYVSTVNLENVAGGGGIVGVGDVVFAGENHPNGDDQMQPVELWLAEIGGNIWAGGHINVAVGGPPLAAYFTHAVWNITGGVVANYPTELWRDPDSLSGTYTLGPPETWISDGGTIYINYTGGFQWGYTKGAIPFLTAGDSGEGWTFETGSGEDVVA